LCRVSKRPRGAVFVFIVMSVSHQERRAPASTHFPLGRQGEVAVALPADQSVKGIAIHWLYRGPLVKLFIWRCLERAPGLTAERSQPWNAIAFVHGGAFRIHERLGSSLIGPTHVLFHNAGASYRTSHPCGCGGDYGGTIVVSDELLREILQAYDKDAHGFRGGKGLCPPGTYIKYRRLVRGLLGSAPLDSIALEEALKGIVREVLAAAHAQQRENRMPAPLTRGVREAVERACDFLVKNYRSPVSVQRVAAAAGLSPSRLAQVFPRIVGMPIHRYLNELRLRRAVDLLEGGRDSLTDLALELGFSSHSHFTFAFRREFGVAPSEWRRDAVRRSAGADRR
jgi:AraC family transcriptional regulator